MRMAMYSFLLAVGLGVSAPWWLWRMAQDGRYREGLGGRLGRVPCGLREAVKGKRVVWIHAVSVGEVLAAARLVGELGERLGAEWVVAVSTTTATGQKVARERFGAGRVFYFPLDFGWVVRRYLRVLRPELVVLVESELWPRLLGDCERARVPVAVVNARVSDRSFARAMRVRGLWGWMGGKVGLWLAQGEESAGRLRELGVEAGRVRVAGNLKYDIGPLPQREIVARLRNMLRGRKLVVAGSTLRGEEMELLRGWPSVICDVPEAVLLIAPRHPERFEEVAKLMEEHLPASRRAVWTLDATSKHLNEFCDGHVVLLDTLGDLSAVYSEADAAFIGGSLFDDGGHNPLEAARFGVPVLMGKSYDNFREVVQAMLAANAIAIVSRDDLPIELVLHLWGDGGMGERGRAFYEGQAGATGRTVEALVELIHV